MEVKVASIQSGSILGDVEGNRQRFANLIREAAKAGAKIIVLPEAAITGYLSQDLQYCWHVPGRQLSTSPIEEQEGDMKIKRKYLPKENLENYAETIPGSSTHFFGDLAKELSVYLVLPLIEQTPRPNSDKPIDCSFFPAHPILFYNSCVLLSPNGEIVAHYRKNNLWGCVDNAWCTAGTETATFDSEYGRIGLAICFDVHIMFDRYKMENLWILLYPIAWVDRDIESWFSIDLPERVKNAGYHVVGANWSIDDPNDGAMWKGYGFSTIYSKDGKIISSAKSQVGSEIVFASLPYSPLKM